MFLGSERINLPPITTMAERGERNRSTLPPVTQQQLEAGVDWGIFTAGSRVMTHLLAPPPHVLQAAFGCNAIRPTEMAYIVVVNKKSQRPKFQLIVDEKQEEVKQEEEQKQVKVNTESSTKSSTDGTPVNGTARTRIESECNESGTALNIPLQIEVNHKPITSKSLSDAPEDESRDDDNENDGEATLTASAAASILTKLAASEKRERKLQMQLIKSGIVAAATGEDIPYAVAKEKIASIAARMNAIMMEGDDAVAADGTTKDEYFQLEKEMEKYNAAIVLTDEYQDELDAAERQWETNIAADNQRALENVRRHMPVDIRRKTVDEIEALHPELPVELVKRFKRTNVLGLLRVNPKDIEAFHPSMLESLRVTGLTLTERRAIHAHLVQVGKRWQGKVALDTTTARKYKWFTMMKTNFREALNKYEYHARQFPSNTVDGSDNNRVQCSCAMKGRGCPIRANATVNYLGDYGCPVTDVYEVSTLSNRDPPATSSTNPAAVIPQKTASTMISTANASRSATNAPPKKESSEQPSRRTELKKHYKRNLLQLSRASVLCESMEEIVQECNEMAHKCGKETASSTDDLVRDLTRFLDNLRSLKKSVEDRIAFLSGKDGISPVEMQLIKVVCTQLEPCGEQAMERLGDVSSPSAHHALRMFETLFVDWEDLIAE